MNLSSDPKSANKNEELLDSEQAENRKDRWRFIVIVVFTSLYTGFIYAL